MNVENIPLVDLHLHLDGALGIEKVYELINKHDCGVKIGSIEELRSLMQVSNNCKDLNEFLRCFDITTKIMQTKEVISELTYELVKRLSSENIIYAEIRFAPQLHIQKGLSMEEVYLAAKEGADMAIKENDSIKVKFILCMMRGENNENYNLDTISLAKKYLNNGVGGIDLAGAEAVYPNYMFEKFFKYAKMQGVPYTIHAGETGDAKSLADAIRYGTTRVGHGIAVVKDEEILKNAKNKNILFEVCPTSNVCTCVCDSVKNHPIKQMLDAGLSVTVCTDDMTVQNSNLRNEYKLLKEAFDFDVNTLIRFNMNAVLSSFMSESDKERYMALYTNLMS